MWREVVGNDFQFHIFSFDKTFLKKIIGIEDFPRIFKEQTKVEQNFSKMTITEDSGLKRKTFTLFSSLIYKLYFDYDL